MGIFNDIVSQYSYNPNVNSSGGGTFTRPSWTDNTGKTYKSDPNSLATSLKNSSFTPTARYTASGGANDGSPTSNPYAAYKTTLNGKDYYYSPKEVFGASNQWSSAAWDPEKAKALGGVEFNRYTGQSGTPWSPQSPYESGYLFENAPDVNQMTWHAGQGSSFRDDFEQQYLPALAMTVGAPMAGSYATGAALPGGLGSVGGGATAISGGGSMSASGSAPGGALMGGGTASAPAGAGLTAPTVNVAGSTGGFTGGSLGSAGYVPSSTGLSMTGGGLGLQAPASGAASLGAGSSGSMFSGLGNLFGGGGVLGTGLTGAQAGMLGLAGTDMYMRQQQQQELQELMDRASREANPLKQEERLPYQKMLSDYMSGGQDITKQPIVKSELDFLQRQAQAQMAKGGMTGSGNAGNIMTDYMIEGLNRTSQPYLNYLAGLGGFNQGVGNSGQIMATLGSQASGAPFQGMNSLGNALGSLMYDERPWWASANNAQTQMQGLGPRSSGVY